MSEESAGLTALKVNLIKRPLSPTRGRRSYSLPSLKRITVGNCLLRKEVLMRYLVARDGLRETSTLPKRRFSRE